VEIEISCQNFEVDEHTLEELFLRLEAHVLDTDATYNFESLRLENTAIGEVKGRMFGDFSFRSLDFFGNLDLTHFDLRTFNKSYSTLKTLLVQGSPIRDNDNNSEELIGEINKFRSLETLILANNELEGLPQRAFGRRELVNLSYIDLSGNSIKEVDRFSFYELPQVNRINLDNNEITYITNQTFSFRNETSRLMLLFLRYNNLTAASFEEGVFGDIEKTTFVYLNHNKITHLEERVFKTVLRSKGDLFLALWHNDFQCDNRSKWLLEDQAFFKKRIHGVRCQDKREIWDWTLKELDQAS
jgi:Leucine-rich repeat (LRR) protein